MRRPTLFWIDYEELSPRSNESSKETMELRCRKRQKIELTTGKGCGALSPTDDNAPNNFCYDSNPMGVERSDSGCSPLNFNRFKQHSGPEYKLPTALKTIGITSPKNPTKNGWLSHHNGYHNILLSCSNGLTAPVVKVNGFGSISNHTNHVGTCCRSSNRRGSRAGRVHPFDETKIVNLEEADDVTQTSSLSTSLEAPEEKAPQVVESPDIVAGSRSERALDVGVELLTDRLTNCCQQSEDFRKFSNLCKEKVSSSSSSVSSTSGRSVVGVKKEKATCQWKDCGEDVEVDVLLEHICRTHVEYQVKENSEESKFVCLWSGCKFYNRSSVLKTWLERHILCHLGDKPYRCIVPQCRMRFASQFLLNRHINRHFSALQSRPLRKGDTQHKKRKLRNTRPCPVKTEDFFDSATMESIQSELFRSTQLTQTELLYSGNTITFQSYIVAKRVDSSGHQEALLHWWPKHMLPDEWVPESEVASYATKVIPLSNLPSDDLQLLVAPSRPHHLARHPHGKKRRK